MKTLLGDICSWLWRGTKFCLYGWLLRLSWLERGALCFNFPIVTLLAVIPYASYHEGEKQCLALNVWHEAAREPLAGQLAVALNTLNRLRSPAYPKTVCDVVYQRNFRGCQYSWTCDKKPDTPYEVIRGSRADLVAREVYGGKWGDLTDRSTHYFAAYLHKKKKAPAWRLAMDKVGRIGEHEFYRDRTVAPPK